MTVREQMIAAGLLKPTGRPEWNDQPPCIDDLVCRHCGKGLRTRSGLTAHVDFFHPSGEPERPVREK